MVVPTLLVVVGIQYADVSRAYSSAWHTVIS